MNLQQKDSYSPSGIYSIIYYNYIEWAQRSIDAQYKKLIPVNIPSLSYSIPILTLTNYDLGHLAKDSGVKAEEKWRKRPAEKGILLFVTTSDPYMENDTTMKHILCGDTPRPQGGWYNPLRKWANEEELSINPSSPKLVQQHLP